MAKPLNFYLITDIHYFAASLGITGKAFERASNSDQKCLAETGAIVDAAFDKLIADKTVDLILIDGDLSCNGEKASHLEFERKLRRLTEAGKHVYVITATHDYNDAPLGYDGDREIVAEGTKREELVNLYRAYGVDQAIAYHPESHSYVVQLAPGYRLLALNDDGDGRGFCGYYPEQMEWILTQIRQAHEAGEYIFAMTHHPALPPSPIYPLFSKRDMLGDYETTTTVLADAGIEFIFTGHTHMQNINAKTTADGNTIYDINTGSLVGYTSPIRRVTLTDTEMQITTEHIDQFDWDLQGKTVQEYLRAHFDYLLTDIFESMAFDMEHFKELARGFSMSPETVDKLKLPIRLAGKALQKLTLGGLGRLTFTARKVDPSVKKRLIKDLFVELVRNIYAGDEPYGPESPIYRAMLAVVNRLAPIIRFFGKGAPIAQQLPELVAGILYDGGLPDNDAVLPRKK